MKGKAMTKRSVMTDEAGKEIYIEEEKRNRYGDIILARAIILDSMMEKKMIIEKSYKNNYIMNADKTQHMCNHSVLLTKIITPEGVEQPTSKEIRSYDISTSNLIFKSRTSYVGDGTCTKVQTNYFHKPNVPESIITTECDGTKREIVHVNTLELPRHITEHQYALKSNKDDIVGVMRYDKNDNIIYDVNEYDNIARYRIYDEKGNILSEQLYLNNIPVSVAEKLYNEVPLFMISKTSYEYNEKGQLIKKSIDTTKVLSTYTYEYAENGNMISMHYVSLPIDKSMPSVNKSDLEQTFTEYEYDEENRLIYEKTTYETIQNKNATARVTETRTTYSA